MAVKTQESELLQKILEDALPPEEEKVSVEAFVQKNPQAALSLLRLYVGEKQRYKAALEKANHQAEGLHQPPWYPATFLRFVSGLDGRVLVAAGNRRFVVSIDPDISFGSLRCGSNVFLNRDMNVLINVAADIPRSGSVGSFSRFHDGRVVVKGGADEQLVVDLAEEIRGTGLNAGDLLLYDRESLVAWEKVERETEDSYSLEEVPDVSFEDIGGLDDVVEEIVDEVSLHFSRPDLARKYRLKPIKGIVFCGPPGCGKTMIAKGLANYLSGLQKVKARFLNVKPGIHRSMWYGKSEENVRELFRLAKSAAAKDGGFVVMFFDDVDHLGSRGDSVATTVDSRVLPSFLHEIDGVEELDRILLIGATNRPDLLDEALLRPGRFGNKVFRIPRPRRDAAREIFRKHLPPELPYYPDGKASSEAAAALIEAALSFIYSDNGDSSMLATLTFRNGSRKSLTAPQVMSGALIANAAAEAKRRGCFRALNNGPAGITSADLLAAIDRELSEIAQRLKPGPALQQMLELPSDLDVVKVEVHPAMKDPRSYEYIRSA